MNDRGTIIDQIINDTRRRLAERKEQRSLAELQHSISGSQPPVDLEACLQGDGIKLIAEIKRASPSRGWLSPNLEAASLAQSYAQGGAAAISVLTEPTYFKGSLDDLATARGTSGLPLLCKDFILDVYQIYEARAHGADAVLLIVAILSPQELFSLIETTHLLGMSVLVEVHNELEIEKALGGGARLIGINNRDLTDFTVDLGTTRRLRSFIPSGIAVVSESGINSHRDIASLQEIGVDAVLVGETLVSSSDPAAKIKELLGGKG